MLFAAKGVADSSVGEETTTSRTDGVESDVHEGSGGPKPRIDAACEDIGVSAR